MNSVFIFLMHRRWGAYGVSGNDYREADLAETSNPAVDVLIGHGNNPIEQNDALCNVTQLSRMMAAGAILDRFLHHAQVIRLQGRSYRIYNRKELRTKQTQETLTGKAE
jgi:hypothetical protein